jgi:C_GCAxxG_C_C family probable redox protein
MKRMSDAERAVEVFLGGCACSQAILDVYGTPLGLDHHQALRVAAGFAGGMRQGDTCGAVTGAFMVLGLRHCSADCNTRAGRAEVYRRVVDFADRFRQRNGSISCRELLGCDISTPEGMKQAQEQNLFKTRCVQMVRDAADILEEMEAESQPAVARDGL